MPHTTREMQLDSLTVVDQPEGHFVCDIAESLAIVGLLRPLIVQGGVVVDGRARHAALRLRGESTATVLESDATPTNPVEAAALRLWRKQAGLPARINEGFSRATLDRVDKITATAADHTASRDVRLVAARGLARVCSGEAVNTVLTAVNRALAEHGQSSAKYPQLGKLPALERSRMSAYLDTLTDRERDVELVALSLTTASAGSAEAVAVYGWVDEMHQRLSQVPGQSIFAAAAASSPALESRCALIADRMDAIARDIRASLAARTGASA